jgi:hypothetical protein
MLACATLRCLRFAFTSCARRGTRGRRLSELPCRRLSHDRQSACGDGRDELPTLFGHSGEATPTTARALIEARENGAAWEALHGRLRGTVGQQPLRLVLPTGPRRSRPVPQVRRERYRTYLQGIIREARSLAPEPEPEPVGPAACATGGSGMAERLCGLCGGGCCTKGGDEAYLRAATLRRFMDDRPGISDEEVLSAYLGHVASVTRAGSCINQTGRGCSLPREMRSDICNRFSCEALARLEESQCGTQPVQAVLIVRRKQDHWRRAAPDLDNAVNALAVLSGGGLRRFRVPASMVTYAGPEAVSSPSNPLQAQPSSPILLEQNAAQCTGD